MRFFILRRKVRIVSPLRQGAKRHVYDGTGNPHYYVTDWQGNNIGVVDRNGLLEQRTRSGGLNEYRFPARDYVPGFPRFTTIDPMCEGTPWLLKI